jgi:sigma-B regulation protein RsbU (phosphoserine phosphatase)
MKESILFVDDEELLLSSYEMLFEEEYDVYLAHSAEEALSQMEKRSFALVISDYDMPGIKGIEFLNIVRKKYPDIIRILLTGFSDINIIVDAVNESNIFRFLIKNDDLRKVISAVKDGIAIYRLIKSERKLKQELEQAYNEINNDLNAAAKLQQNIQPPSSSFAGYSFAAMYLPSKYLSGDNYNFFQIDDFIIYYVLDVTGKGIPASMMSFAISRLINSDKIPNNPTLNFKENKYEVKSPSEVLHTLNQTFLTKDDDIQFFTICYGIIDLKKSISKIGTGGHRKPILIRGDKVEFIELKGMPIGFMDDPKIGEIEIELNSDDKLILYSDGLPELVNSKGEMFGEERIIDILKLNHTANSNELIDIIEFHITNWTEGHKPDDDITVLTIQKI